MPLVLLSLSLSLSLSLPPTRDYTKSLVVLLPLPLWNEQSREFISFWLVQKNYLARLLGTRKVPRALARRTEATQRVNPRFSNPRNPLLLVSSHLISTPFAMAVRTKSQVLPEIMRYSLIALDIPDSFRSQISI